MNTWQYGVCSICDHILDLRPSAHELSTASYVLIHHPLPICESWLHSYRFMAASANLLNTYFMSGLELVKREKRETRPLHCNTTSGASRRNPPLSINRRDLLSRYSKTRWTGSKTFWTGSNASWTISKTHRLQDRWTVSKSS
jgi:hypothetical protein